MRLWNKIVPVLIFLYFLNAQTISTIDTVHVSKDQKYVQIKPFVIDSSLYVFNKGLIFNAYEFDHIHGHLELDETFKNDQILHLSYSYLKEVPPKTVGPLYLSFSPIDSLLINQEVKGIEKILSPEIIDRRTSNLATTGTIYRNISLSPIGGSDFTGGLQLQLQGQLTEDILVSGVLSDQSIPIQPEGTTQTLDEIDKVYLHVTHPVFQIMAGDIDYTISSGKYLNVSRKLEGLRGTLQTDKWKAQGVLASSRGRYRKTEFKGVDGNQGPYQLSSDTGSSDIIILAGTEKIYVNGELKKRGENYDYTMDYSLGELSFTPKVLIDFDTDIYVEYQYSDFQYSRNILGGSVVREIGDFGHIGFTWLKEKDQLLSDDPSNSDFLDSLKRAGDNIVAISGAKSDEDGDYIYENNIYIYSPLNTIKEKFSVSFQNNNETGNYVRKITDQGEIYYEYIADDLKTEDVDYYSPFITHANPRDHQLFQVTGDIQASDLAKLNWDVTLSNLDKNVLSDLDDDDNMGIAYNLQLKGNSEERIPDFEIGYNFINWIRSKSFRDISKDRDPLFEREWNIDDIAVGQEAMLTGGVDINYKDLIKSYSEISNYNSVKDNKGKYLSQITAKTKFIPIFNSKISRVHDNNSEFYKFNIYSEFLPGAFNPIFDYKGESKSREYRFDISKIGFQYKKNKNNISASIARRNDFFVNRTDSTKMDLIKENIFCEVSISGKLRNSFFADIVFKRRFSDNYQTDKSENYAVGLAKLRYVDKNSPLRWEFLSKLEETMTESRAVVFDSVGVGLGSYRFDEDFNEYIADPNGEYISYTVLTGERELTTNFNGSQRLHIDFGKTSIKLLKNIDLRSDFKSEFRGIDLSVTNILDPSIENTTINSSKINFRNEIDYNTKNRFIRNWYVIIKNLNGNDPRGNDLKNQNQFGIQWRENIVKTMNANMDFQYHEYEYSSNFSELRNRNVYGWWIDEQIKWTVDRKWQFTLALVGGKDSGSHNSETFDAYSYGVNIVGQRFIKSTTSIKFRLDLNNSISKNGILPPEALNGLPIGSSVSININGHVLLGNNLSLNTSVSYIDNSRYDKFVTISGELRAYF